ncbi:MAG: uroporphyrinogen-III C-methyltransferase, partial [Dermatophilaceae bacterium]
ARELGNAREAGARQAGSVAAGSSRPVIAMAGGRAFTFQYAETEELLRADGCDVVTFDPLTDAALPPGTAGLYVGGGFPQVHAADLTANAPLREHIRDAVFAGLPTVGECAGLLYLCRSVDDAPMVGALPLTAAMTSKLTLGYRQAIAPADTLLARTGERVVGHEFHRTATAPVDPTDDTSRTHEDADVPGVASAWLLDGHAEGVSADPAGLGRPSVHASYLHTHWAGRPQLASRFVDAVRAFAVSGRAVPDAPRGVPSTAARPVREQSLARSATSAADAPVGHVGEVILVGGGPGDPGLLTVAGLQAIQAADAVVYDRLAPLASLAEAPAGAELIEVGKIPRGAFTSQERIHEILIEQARAGRRVVRLKGGDPFVFGRGGEEWQACVAAGVPVRVIPGVTSCVAVPELAGVPVTHRHLTQGFTVVSGHVPPDDPRSSLDWDALARTQTTLVILMGVKYLPEITARLVAAGLDPTTPAVVLEDGCSPAARTVRGEAADIAERAVEHAVRPPAITVIGHVAGLDLDAPG